MPKQHPGARTRGYKQTLAASGDDMANENMAHRVPPRFQKKREEEEEKRKNKTLSTSDKLLFGIGSIGMGFAVLLVGSIALWLASILFATVLSI